MKNAGDTLTSGEHDEYIFRTGDVELVRLGYQHRVWAESLFSLWDRAGFAPGWRILDVGAGPGFCTIDLAHLVGPTGRVVAVDRSERFLEHIRRKMEVEPLDNVETIESDLLELALPPASFDGATVRWVLCYLNDPLAALKRVAEALKPGGAFTIQEYSDYLVTNVTPESRAYRVVLDAISAMWTESGGDHDIGRRLPVLLDEAGFDVREARPLVRAGRPGTAFWQWPTIFFMNILAVLVEQGHLSSEASAAFEREWAERSNNPNAVFVSPPMMEFIAVKR